MLVCLSVPTSLHLRRRRVWLQLSISVKIHLPSRHEKRWTLLTMTFEFKLSRRITSTLVSGNKRQPMTYTPGLGGREMLGGDGATPPSASKDMIHSRQLKDVEIGMPITGRHQGAGKTHAFDNGSHIRGGPRILTSSPRRHNVASPSPTSWQSRDSTGANEDSER